MAADAAEFETVAMAEAASSAEFDISIRYDLVGTRKDQGREQRVGHCQTRWLRDESRGWPHLRWQATEETLARTAHQFLNVTTQALDQRLHTRTRYYAEDDDFSFFFFFFFFFKNVFFFISLGWSCSPQHLVLSAAGLAGLRRNVKAKAHAGLFGWPASAGHASRGFHRATSESDNDPRAAHIYCSIFRVPTRS